MRDCIPSRATDHGFAGSARPCRAAGAADDTRAADAVTTADGYAQVLRALGTPPPASVAALPDDVLLRLAAQIRSGRRQRGQLAQAAAEHAIRGVPLPVRAVVRKALSWS